MTWRSYSYCSHSFLKHFNWSLKEKLHICGFSVYLAHNISACHPVCLPVMYKCTMDVYTKGTRRAKVSMFVNPAISGVSTHSLLFRKLFVFILHFNLIVEWGIINPSHWKNVLTNGADIQHLNFRRLMQRPSNLCLCVVLIYRCEDQ